MEAWVLRQSWLVLDLQGRVRSRVGLPLTAVDQVISRALPPGVAVRKAVLIQAIVGSGYFKGSAEVAIHRAPYISASGQGLLHG